MDPIGIRIPPPDSEYEASMASSSSSTSATTIEPKLRLQMIIGSEITRAEQNLFTARLVKDEQGEIIYTKMLGCLQQIQKEFFGKRGEALMGVWSLAR